MSAKELNIGDYVRTLEYIRKIRKIKDNYVYCDLGVFEFNEIIKSSSNIIDLIEVGDILEIKDMLGNISKVEVDENFKLLSGTIVAITTHEQYEANKYKIGE